MAARWPAVRAMVVAITVAGSVSACAKIPPDSYGVARLELDGVDELSANALRACLATRERPHVGIDFGTSSEPTCNQPPFDGGGSIARLWAWPWTDWPLWDVAVFERDIRRIERWYRARGYYDARVREVEISPAGAAESDRVAEGEGEGECERRRGQGCEVEVRVEIEEGEPVRTEGVALWVSLEEYDGERGLPPPPEPRVPEESAEPGEQDEQDEQDEQVEQVEQVAEVDAQPNTEAEAEARAALNSRAEAPRQWGYVRDSELPIRFEAERSTEMRAAAEARARGEDPPRLRPRSQARRAGRALRNVLQGAVQLPVGEPFDEALYDRTKSALVEALLREGYACGHVLGAVGVNPSAKLADVALYVHLGRRCRVAEVSVEGDDVPVNTILGAASLRTGDVYRVQDIREAQRAVYALGAFSEVDIVGTPRRDEEGHCTGLVDVVIRVTRGRTFRYGVGVGVQTGQVDDAQNISGSVPQWDLHLLLFLEHRDFLGGLRRIRLEDRPKLILQTQRTGQSNRRVTPRPGNELRLEFRQPAFLESRTTLTFGARWDYGPDPNQGFFRHDVDTSIRVSRPFFEGKLILSAGVHWNLQRTTDDQVSSDHTVQFFEEYVQLDLRDDSRRPREGLFVSLGFHQSPAFMGSSWTYYRFTPEARAYLPLPLGAVFAMRLGLGATIISSPDPSLDRVSAQLGPQRYRLRGGGPSSHRGFPAGFLGDAQDAGVGSFCLRNDPPPDVDCAEANSGGLRRWEANLEIRAPITPDFGAVLFADMGDVSRSDSFRLRHIHLAVGFGIRYQTLVGPVRLDIGILARRAQTINRTNLAPINEVNLGLFKFPGAIHLTIGEAF